MRQLPLYLQEVIRTTASIQRPTAYDDLITLLQERSLSVMFVTTNYDRLIERAINRKYAAEGRIESLRDYVRGDRDWALVKLHGSVDWGFKVPDRSRHDNDSDDRVLFIHVPSDEEMLAEYLEDTSDYETEGSLILTSETEAPYAVSPRLYPALAVPRIDKYTPVCPPEHADAVRQAVAEARAIVVIGSRGVDADLMDVLRLRAPTTPPMLEVVDPKDEEQFEIVQRFREVLGITSGHVGSPSGFRPWLKSGRAEEFLDEVERSLSSSAARYDPAS